MPDVDDKVVALPSITALFLVVFDQKIGYKLSWQRTTSNTQLEGVVEYKSLPSGLHNVKQDLVYFTHEGYAGLSAFASSAAGEADRNARFLAVGVLVPLSYGRLGRAWLHADNLRQLASSRFADDTNTTELDTYWETHALKDLTDDLPAALLAEPSSPATERPSIINGRKRRSRALSEAAGFSVREHVLSHDHPALSMPDYIETFGPLAFPLHRAALLRKRILFLGSIPIQKTCNYVYNLSIFSNLPASLVDKLPAPSSLHRIRPLFNVGIHDIPELATRASQSSDEDEGWVACTTDDILSTKRQLFDVIVRLPSGDRSWPTISTSSGDRVLATQRDWRRYNALRKELHRMQCLNETIQQDSDDGADEPAEAVSTGLSPGQDEDTNQLLHSITSLVPDDYSAPSLENEAEMVEPTSWASMAYSSFLWWASAGERGVIEEEEREQDASLIEDLVSTTSAPATPLLAPVSKRRSSLARRKKRLSATSLSRSSEQGVGRDDDHQRASIQERQQISMILIAYFQRLTSLILSGLGDIVGSEDDEAAAATRTDDRIIVVTAEEVRRLGLDVWSAADASFLHDVGWLWWDSDIRWNGRGIECCGVKIC